MGAGVLAADAGALVATCAGAADDTARPAAASLISVSHGTNALSMITLATGARVALKVAACSTLAAGGGACTVAWASASTSASTSASMAACEASIMADAAVSTISSGRGRAVSANAVAEGAGVDG
jgi:hypothetical protein